MTRRYLATVVGLLGFGFLAAGTDESKPHSSSSPSPTSTVAKAPSGAQLPPMPQTEQQFCDAVQSASTTYRQAKDSGANELKLSKIRTTRKAAIVSAVPGRKAMDWVGTVGRLSTNGDGKAVLEIELPCGAVVKTWNNDVSDASDQTLIPQGTPLFNVISELDKGRAVRFSGRLFSDGVNGLKEVSMTEEGSMTEPEFLVKFSAVSAL